MVVKIPKLERLMNLVSALLASREPVPFRDIVGRVIGYDDAAADEALEKRFDRDKADLRALGIPIEYVASENDLRGGYVIKPEEAFLGRIDFTPDETVLLAIAGRVGTSATGGGALEEALKGALRKLAIDMPLPDAQSELGNITTLRARHGDARSIGNVARLADAVSTGHRVSFTYHALGADAPTERTVDPYGIGLATGTWYLVGHCHLREGLRVFKIARIQGEVKVLARKAGETAFLVPPDFDVHEHIGREAWQWGEARPEQVVLETAAGISLDIPGAEITELEGGRQRIALEARRKDALVGWILAHGGRVTVREPEDLRDRVAAEARRLLERYGDEGTADAGGTTPPATTEPPAAEEGAAS